MIVYIIQYIGVLQYNIIMFDAQIIPIGQAQLPTESRVMFYISYKYGGQFEMTLAVLLANQTVLCGTSLTRRVPVRAVQLRLGGL